LFLLTRVITELAFGNLLAEVERLILRRKVDMQDMVPCHLLAPETFDGNRCIETS
jgi:hypothetical protein